jgi:ornithine cyclodeaminase/alanine dehydrogenase-like protein (mu-crystallin family)
LADPAGPTLTLRFVAGPDVDALRGHLGPEHVSGVKVVGDFVGNWRLGLPSELALVLLLDPDTGMPVGIVDGTWLTAARTGALTALGAGKAPGRQRPDERALFWHRGLATTDLAVAQLLLRRAADAGLGTLVRYR